MPASDPAPEESRDLLADRRRKLDRLRDEFGIDPFGGPITGLISLAAARERYDEAADEAHKADAQQDARPRVRIAGRVMQHRVMGNLIFMLLRDASGDLQLAVSKKLVGPETFKLAKLVDLSDIVAAEGALAKTKTGEITVWAGGRGQGPEGSRDRGTEGPREEGPRDQGGNVEGEDGASSEHSTSEIRDSTSSAAPSAPRPLDPLAPSGFTIAAKSLALPPGKWHGLQDAEQRYRKRYVDLYANPEVMQRMQLRIRIVQEIRDYLRGRGFVEVETPMLQAVHGGAAARPFQTHHNALDLPLYLRIAPELYLKRLLVGGFPKIFEINRNFRNEGVSPRHNPEFTMLEAYEAFGSWETMADLVEDMVCTVAMKVCGTLEINHEDTKGTKKTINLTRRWPRIPMADLVEKKTGWKFEKERGLQPEHAGLIAEAFANSYSQRFIEQQKSTFGIPQAFHERQPGESPQEHYHRMVGDVGMRELQDEAKRYVKDVLARTPAEQLVEVYEKLIEPTLIDPTFVTRVPGDIIPLARRCNDDPYFADVYELAINGVEISPGYSELNDPDVQEQHLRHQVGDREEQQQVDEDFIEALRVGMPPAGGIGLGIDRLVALLTGAESLRDVILFPLMRPKE